ncbi:hypothetical protein BDV37DRAFT_280877 [Aspergillus pseudonomiae]|uniref:Uncharacterized protein n=1 Tax=Aspergillus pseudonomiae TaxID=1506151 RepID=A0A5N7DMA2_9EURO|nr:uncharacterized protein BDV37DRAFT_280877 [Aspergillus pseudonomiae]KAE8406608.1 hypothetical protein BDV37DRAFT_280877 [Aspergillus pseudonomiae]
MSTTVHSLRRIVPLQNTDEMRMTRQNLLKRMSDTELTALAAVLQGGIRSDRASCYKYIIRALNNTVGDSLRDTVNRVQELQGSRFKQLLDALISIGEYEKKFNDRLLGEYLQ